MTEGWTALNVVFVYVDPLSRRCRTVRFCLWAAFYEEITNRKYYMSYNFKLWSSCTVAKKKRKVFTLHLRSFDYITLHRTWQSHSDETALQYKTHSSGDTFKGGFHSIYPCLGPNCRVEVKNKYHYVIFGTKNVCGPIRVTTLCFSKPIRKVSVVIIKLCSTC